MVMAVKESNKISQLEHVSKTKVRGVLALLKHGDLLITQGAEGEPVRLYLAPGIETYKDLREKHDIFLGRYMLEHHLFIPAILKSELTWQFEEDVKAQRLETLNKLVTQLQHFYTSYIAYQEKLAAEGGGPAGDEITSSEDGGSSAPLVSSASASSASSVVGDGDWNYVRPQSLPIQKTTKQPTASEFLENRPKSLGTYQQQQQQQQHYIQQQRNGGYGSSFMPNNIGNSYGAGSSYQSMLQQRQQQAQFQQHQQLQQQQQHQFQQQQRGYSTGDLQSEYRMYGSLNGVGLPQAPSNNYRGGNSFQNPAFKASSMGNGGMRSPYGSHLNNSAGGNGYGMWQQQQQQAVNVNGINKYDNGFSAYGAAQNNNYLSPTSQYPPSHLQQPEYNAYSSGDDGRLNLVSPTAQQNLHYSGTFQPQNSMNDLKYGAYSKPPPSPPQQQQQIQQQQQGYQAGMRTSFARGSVSLDPQQLSPPNSQPNSQSTQQQQWSPNSATSRDSKVVGSTPIARVTSSGEFVGNVDHPTTSGKISNL